MEKIVVGRSLLPSGKAVVRLALLSPLGSEAAGMKMLMADDGETIYARQYPHLDANRPDEWDEVGPYTGSPNSAYVRAGFDKSDLSEFDKDA